MNKALYAGIGILLLAAIVIGVSQLRPASESVAPQMDTTAQQENPGTVLAPAETTTPAAPATPDAPKTYTMADVRAHATAQSCWVAVEGFVYDVTAFIPQHPGGPQRIIALCGTDGTAAFMGQHGGARRPQAELASLKIGALVQ